MDEESKEDRANTKKLMTKLLQSGKNVMIFPEGAWNLSENEIVCDLAYGAADAAISANAVIVPIAVEQYGKHFVICSGDMLDPLCLQIDKHNLTMILRDELASLRCNIWESRGVCPRSALADDYWDKFIRERYAEWKGYSMREQIINSYIPKEKLEYWQVQRNLKTNKIPLWYRILLEEENA